MRLSQAQNLARWIESRRPVQTEVCTLAPGRYAVAVIEERPNDHDSYDRDIRFTYSAEDAAALFA